MLKEIQTARLSEERKEGHCEKEGPVVAKALIWAIVALTYCSTVSPARNEGKPEDPFI